MIRITVTQKDGAYVSVESEGHADYAEEGQDIICSAVSALIVNAVNSIETFTEDRILCESDDGYVYFSLPDGHGDAAIMEQSI